MSTDPTSEPSGGRTDPWLRIHRRSVPWRPRLRGGRTRRVGQGAVELAGDVGTFADVPIVGWVLVPFALLLVVVFVVLSGPFLVLIAVELAVVALAFPLFVLVRTLRGEPWPVEARDADGAVVARWWVHGWREAGRRARELQGHHDAGRSLPPTEVARP
ncbi:hypothetical protein FTX61_15795 [Nitriliruptoraceae bacterium ZYF776]|nr:hypothetical protein [Profundirhabdus halotolerans]